MEPDGGALGADGHAVPRPGGEADDARQGGDAPRGRVVRALPAAAQGVSLVPAEAERACMPWRGALRRKKGEGKRAPGAGTRGVLSQDLGGKG